MLPISQITFEPRINFGTILEIVIFVTTGIGLYIRIEKRITALEDKVDILFEWWKNKVMNGKV